MADPTPTLLTRVDKYVQAQHLLRPGARVVLGLSGGVDSITLAHLLQRLGYEVLAAHVNYGLRGDAADADEAFVRSWCAAQTPPIPAHVKSMPTKREAEGSGRSVQALAREQRYAFFEQIAQEEGCDTVAVAHHRDDQAETVLLNLFRGSGLKGLQGMQPARSLTPRSNISLVRPLLTTSRDEIRAYAQANELAWRRDASNRDLTYRRNAVRHAILPAVRDHFEGAPERIARAAETLQQYAAHTFQPELERRFTRCVKSGDEDGGFLAIGPLAEQPPVWRQRVLLEALRRWMPGAPERTAFLAEIDALCEAQVGRHVACRAGRIWRVRGGLRMVPAAAAPGQKRASAEMQVVEWGVPVTLPEGTLRVERLPGTPHPKEVAAAAPHTAFVDAERLTAPLTARRWADGDRFQPLGMDGHKLVSDFLTDERVPPHRRRAVLVLCAEGQVVWVVGHRLAHPFRLRTGTTCAAKLTFRPAAVNDPASSL